MNESLKRAWVYALRSGNYKQGRQKLMTDKGEFCALGVLCDIVAKRQGYSWKDSPLRTKTGSFLPPEVVKAAGFDTADPRVLVKRGHNIPTVGVGGVMTISLLNDNYKVSFEKIADLIEEQL